MRFLLLAAALAGVPAALGHGAQSRPPSRHEPVCGNRVSGDSVMRTGCTGGGGTFGFGGGTPGLCGDGCMRSNDAAQAQFGPTTFAEQPCQAEPEVYVEGGVLEVEWIINAYHGGFIQCNVCDDSFNLSEECFDRYPLETVGRSSGGEDADPERIHDQPTSDLEGNYRWYIYTGRDATNPIKQSFRLPAGLTCELCAVQCIWWTHTVCTYPCEPEVCGELYSAGINNVAWPPGHRLHDQPLGQCDTFTPGPGESPQMFAQCGDFKIVSGDGEVTQEPDAEEPDADEPDADELAEEEMAAEEPDADELAEEESTAEELAAEEPAAEEPAAEEPAAEEPAAEEPAEAPVADEPDADATATETSPPDFDGNFEGLAVLDLASGATVRLSHTGEDTIDLSDYPEGLGIEAEFVSNDLVYQVMFATDSGHTRTEGRAPYDMFGSMNRRWPGLEPGLTVQVTVTAIMTDGLEEVISTSISFDESFSRTRGFEELV